MIELTLLPTAPLTTTWASRLFVGAIPAELRARWCVVRVSFAGDANARAVVVLDLGDDVAVSRLVSPDRGPLLLFIPDEARAIRVALLGVADPLLRLLVRATPISRLGAAARLLASAPVPILRAALGGRTGRGRRVRAALAQASGEAPPTSHGLWATLFDHWSAEEATRLVASTGGAATELLALVMCAGGMETEAARATIDSLAAQALPSRVRALAHGAPLAGAIAEATEAYVAILQAGEVVPRHATALLASRIARDGAPPDAVYADEDELSADGIRLAPLFKPGPSRSLMLSGTLTRGIWLFRRDWLAAHAPDAAGWAEALRLDLWLRLHESGRAGATRHVPFILTHRRPDAEAAPPAALVTVAAAHFARIGASVRIAQDTLPLRVRPMLAGARDRTVALIVPSTLRGPHVRRCLRAVLQRTDHQALEVLLVVSQAARLDAAQHATLAAIGAAIGAAVGATTAGRARPRVLILPVERFNYAAANNFAVGQTDAEFVCLLNDDVAPIASDWLTTMLGHFADPEIGAVGAKLLYENETVQHGGILMGLAGLAEHANRGSPRAEAGYAHRAVLSQELSAVTGACLLTRRASYLAVGGMDEGFPIAFNDVDFCLKLRRAGQRIVFCAEAELTHYESASLGHHFSGERAALEREEVRRMRQRWAAEVAADPFHNPNLSLARGQEWSSAFPPRVSRWTESAPTAASDTAALAKAAAADEEHAVGPEFPVRRVE